MVDMILSMLEMLLDGVIRACDLGRPGECYILSNRYVPVKELLDTVSEVRHTKRFGPFYRWVSKINSTII